MNYVMHVILQKFEIFKFSSEAFSVTSRSPRAELYDPSSHNTFPVQILNHFLKRNNLRVILLQTRNNNSPNIYFTFRISVYNRNLAGMSGCTIKVVYGLQIEGCRSSVLLMMERSSKVNEPAFISTCYAEGKDEVAGSSVRCVGRSVVGVTIEMRQQAMP